MARWLIVAGLLLLVSGVVLHFMPGLLNWFGKLPGDIHIERERTKVFVPVTSMLLISILLTILLNLLNR